MFLACDREVIEPPTPPHQSEQVLEEAPPEGSGSAAITADDRSEPEPVPNIQLETRIRVRLMAEDELDLETITIRADNGVVWLEGTAEADSIRSRAEALVRETIGVHTVHNTIDAPPPTTGNLAITEVIPEPAPEPAPEPILEPAQEPIAVVAAAEDPPEAQPAEEPTADDSLVPDSVGADSGSEAPLTYTVQSGDILSIIARDFLGTGARWVELYEANRDVIGENPSGLRAGMVLTIPSD